MDMGCSHLLSIVNNDADSKSMYYYLFYSACGIIFLQWKNGVLTTAAPGKPLKCFHYIN